MPSLAGRCPAGVQGAERLLLVIWLLQLTECRQALVQVPDGPLALAQGQVALRDLEQAHRVRVLGAVLRERPGRLGQGRDGLFVTAEPVIGVTEQVKEIRPAEQLSSRAGLIVGSHAAPSPPRESSPVPKLDAVAY
jgi:hypothetical protein